MRYFITLAYKGAQFHGWQVQPGQVTVQSRLQEALSTLMRQPIAITGAGRTDSGVNASMMVAHFDTEESIKNPETFLRGLNSLTGYDIAVYRIKEVHPEAHARFDATSRTYHYYAHTNYSPFDYPLSWRMPSLDIDAMNEAASLMLGRRDFTSFSKLHTDVKTNICDLREARWIKLPQDPMAIDNPLVERYVFVITADRFLRNMVRAVVGTLVEVGRGKIPPQGILEILQAKDRCLAGTSMPAHALFLADIKYPYEI